MADATVTRRALSLGSQDSTTGWYATSYATTSIEGSIQPRGTVMLGLPIGNVAVYNETFFTDDTVYEGDEIYDALGNYYQIKTRVEWDWLDQFSHYVCELVRRDQATPPTTSGTWHLDSDSAKTDSRYRIKALLDGGSGITATHLKEDNGTTNATYITCFDYPVYPITKVFNTKTVDLIISIEKIAAKPLYNYVHYPYAFIETVTVGLWSVDKSGLTATNLLEQAEEELREIFTDNPTTTGAIRRIESTAYEVVDIGATRLWHTTVTIEYKRVNDEYTPATPTFAEGIGFTYEGDRLTYGAEGTWTLTQGAGSTCAQSIDAYNQLDLNQTVFGGGANDSYTTNGTNLALSTTVYARIRGRYKTSGASTAKVVVEFSDASTQTIRTENASATWTTFDVALTTAKTLDHIILYNCDGVGHVYYDFVQVYSSMYILPNVVRMPLPHVAKAAELELPAYSGAKTQLLGDKMEFTMTCDLDIEPTALRWKRPQATGATDKNKWDVFSEFLHYEGCNAQNPWTWMDLGDPQYQFKVQLLSMEPDMMDDSLLVLKWREYRHGDAGNETYAERYGTGL